MKFQLDTTYNRETVIRRLRQIFGCDEFQSIVGENIQEFISIGSGNNLAIHQNRNDAGNFVVWYRYELPDNFREVIEALL